MAVLSGTEGNDTLVGGAEADEINGFAGNDFLQGGDADDAVLGGGGNDTISGNSGDDWVRGGTGNDQVAGGRGQDSFAFAESGAANADVLTDFSSGWDNLQLDRTGFSALGATGRFTAGDARFHSGSAAHDADDRIIYDQASGQLWYDADGNGAGAAQLIATLANRPALSATDLFVYQSTTPPPPPPPPSGTISGTSGNDSLVGGAGSDTITGGAGNDTITGAGGADVIVLDAAPGTANADSVTDFVSGTDRIQLHAGVMSGLGAGGNFSASDARFHAANFYGGMGWAHDNTDRIVYDTSTGNLWYVPAPGDPAAPYSYNPPQLIATLQGAPAISAADFVVVNASPSAGVMRDGTDGNDSLAGTAGNDTLHGGLGDDTLQGLAGNDSLDGGEGSDSIAGGDGNDTLHGGGEYNDQYDTDFDTLDGGLGNDTYVIGRQIARSPWWDSSDRIVLNDAGGIDTIVARSGYWKLDAGFENLVLINGYGEGGTYGVGNAQNNVIRAHTHPYVSSTLDGGDGDDTLIGGDGRDRFTFVEGGGNYGNDWIDAGGDEDTLDFTGARSAVVIDFRAGTATGGGTGGSGSVSFINIDIAVGGDFNDRLVAGDTVVQYRYGDQWGPTLRGGGGNDTLLGGAQIDWLRGETGDDEIRGGGGGDRITGGAGNDRLFGDAGDDHFAFAGDWVNNQITSSGADTVDGGDGSDTLGFDGAQSAVRVDLAAGTASGGSPDGAGTISVTGIENVFGSGYADRITGNAAANVLTGNAGDDTLFGGGGDDTIWVAGGYGYGGATQAYGQDGNDVITGGYGADRLEGGAGNDSLDGFYGRDTLSGGAGQDTLLGYGDRDTFLFDVAPGLANADVVNEFMSGEDTLLLDLLAMPQLGAGGRLGATDGRFHAAAGANGGHDADDRIVYNTSTGQLWYDADGSGSASAQLIATLSGARPLAATDIAVYNASAPFGQQIDGTAFSDTLIGGGGSDTINGLEGDDYLATGGGNDRLDGGSGYDRLHSGAGNDTLVGGEHGDVFLFLNSSATYGRDVVDGGSGWDNVFFDGLHASSGVVVDLAAGTVSGGGSNGGDGATIAGIEAVNGTSFGDRLSGNAESNTFYGHGGGDTLVGAAGDDYLSGDAGNDSISGGAGDDYLYGGQGIDTLDGGAGDDYYEVTAGDAIAFDAGGQDRVSAHASWTLAPELEVLYLNGTSGGTFTGTGNALDNLLQGNTWDASFILSGLAGNDTLHGGGSADTLLGGAGNDSLFGSYGGDSLSGGDGNDTLNGSSGHDTLTGGAGADRFQYTNEPYPDHSDAIADFTSGVDRLVLDGNAMWRLGTGGDFSASDPRFHAAAGANAGHDVDDRVIFNTTTGEVWYDNDGSGAGASQLIATLQPGGTLLASDVTVENGGVAGIAVNGTAGNDSLVGTWANDTLNGLGGNDTLDGGSADDRLVGGAGDDLYFVDNEKDVVVELENEGIDEVRAGSSYTLPDWVNNLTLIRWGYGYGNALDNVIRGSAEWNSLNGLGGNDTLIGGAGRDSLTGDAGADVFVFNVAPDGDWVYDFAPGEDRVQLDAGIMTTLGASGTMSAGDARFHAAAGANAGHDSDDRLVYNTTTGQLWYDHDGAGGSAAQLIATFERSPALSAGDITIINSSSGALVTGTAGNDSLVGTANNDTINGLAGNDTIDGGAGADYMTGGAGNDVYIIDHVWDVLVELENGGIDEARASVSFTLPNWVNNLTLWSGAADGIGNDVDNVIVGNAGWNVLAGHGGNDTLLGGGSNDTLVGGIGDDSLDGGAGVDSLVGGDGNDTLASGANEASSMSDTLDGGAGADVMIGGAGNTLFYVDNAGDALSDAGGFDSILSTLSVSGHDWVESISLLGSASSSATGNALANNIYGNAGSNGLQGLGGNDWLYGSDGNDTLDGGAGNDTLYGGWGIDDFVLASAPGSANADAILDFRYGGSDRIHLDARVMTSLGASGQLAIGDARFYAASGATAGHDADDRIVYDTSTGNLYYDADGNGAAPAQLIATLNGAPTLSANEIVIDNAAPAGVAVNGTSGNDSLSGGGGNDTLNGLAGNDTLNGGAGADSMTGGANDDVYIVDDVADMLVELVNGGIDEARASVSFTLPDWVNNLTLLAGAVNGTGNGIDNVIAGNAAANQISGGIGADRLSGAGGNDTLSGGADADHFIFGAAPGAANADFITDFASGADKIRLDASAMTALGAGGNFSVGDTRFWDGGAAHDADDRVIFDAATGQLWYDADGTGASAAQLIATVSGTVVSTDIAVDNGSSAPPPAANGTEGNDTMLGTASSDTLNGLGGNDFIQGNGSGDTLRGGAGNDTLGGNDGADWLEGGAGNDRIAGGRTQDAFVFREFGEANADTLADFSGNNWDSLRFDNAAFTALGADGRFVSGDARFRAGTAAADGDDRIIYDAATAQVWYDADGNGAGAAQLVATLQAGATLLTSDIWVV